MKAVECSRNTGSSRKETIHLSRIYIYINLNDKKIYNKLRHMSCCLIQTFRSSGKTWIKNTQFGIAMYIHWR